MSSLDKRFPVLWTKANRAYCFEFYWAEFGILPRGVVRVGSFITGREQDGYYKWHIAVHSEGRSPRTLAEGIVPDLEMAKEAVERLWEPLILWVSKSSVSENLLNSA